MGSNHTLRPSEGGTVTRAAPCRAPLRRWEWRAVAHAQGAPRFRTRTAGWDPGGPSLATCRSAQCAQSSHVWTYMDPARLQPTFGRLSFKVTTADVYPASLRGLIDHRREPRWIFVRFHLNAAKALAEAMPVQTPVSGSDGVTVSPSSTNRCNC